MRDFRGPSIAMSALGQITVYINRKKFMFVCVLSDHGFVLCRSHTIYIRFT